MKNWYQRVTVPIFLNSGMASKRFEKIRHIVLAEAYGTTLEIGVGPGYNIPLYRNVSKLYALEPFQELIDIARNRAKGLSFPIEFLKAGAESIPLPDGSVDTVVSTWTLCSVDSVGKVLKEIQRILRPEGKFIFVDHGASPSKVIHFIQKFLTPITKYFTGNCHYDRKIEEIIIQAGFKIQKMEYSKEKFRPLIYNFQGIARLK